MRYFVITVLSIGVGALVLVKYLGNSIPGPEAAIYFLVLFYLNIVIVNYLFGKEIMIPYMIYKNTEEYKVHRAVVLVICIFLETLFMWRVVSS